MKHKQTQLKPGEIAFTVLRVPRVTIRQRAIVECVVEKVHTETVKHKKGIGVTTFVDYTIKTPFGIFRVDFIHKNSIVMKAMSKLKRPPINFKYD